MEGRKIAPVWEIPKEGIDFCYCPECHQSIELEYGKATPWEWFKFSGPYILLWILIGFEGYTIAQHLITKNRDTMSKQIIYVPSVADFATQAKDTVWINSFTHSNEMYINGYLGLSGYTKNDQPIF